MASSDGIVFGTTHDLDFKYPVNHETGKRPGIMKWEGTGLDISRHPDGPDHNPATCGICK